MWTKTGNALILLNGLFLVLFISLLGYYYRLVPEDYYAVIGNHRYGIWQQAIVVCNQWGGRFFSYMFSFLLLDIYEKGISFTWYFLVGNSVLMYSMFRITSYIIKHYSLSFTRHEVVSIAVIEFIALFYLTPGIQESWFWIPASTSYYWGIVMVIAGIAFVCAQKIRWFNILPAGCCFLYVCSASEPFALMILFLLVIGLVAGLKWRNSKAFFALLVIFCFAIAGFLIMYFAKGTNDRWMAMPDLTFTARLFRLAGAIGKYFIFWFPQLLIITLFFIPFFFIIGTTLKGRGDILSGSGLPAFLFIAMLAYCFIIMLAFLPACFVMGESGPMRSWHHIGLYNTVFALVFFAFVGYRFEQRIKISKNFLNVFLLMISCLHVFFLSDRVYVAKEYAKAVDKRMALLINLQERHYTGILNLERLPDSGLLFSAEIGSEKDFYLNQFLKQGLNLEFDIQLKKE